LIFTYYVATNYTSITAMAVMLILFLWKVWHELLLKTDDEHRL